MSLFGPRKPRISEVENAFLPAREIDDIERFAGRQDKVETAYLSLLTEGANLAIIGNRGIGKSSLARQLIRIAEGSTDLLDKLKVAHDGPLDYLTVYLACGREVHSTDQLLERLLTSSQCLNPWIYEIPQAREELEKYTPKFSVKPGGVGVELGGEKHTKITSKGIVTEHSVHAVFANVLASMAKANLARNGVLIIVDEFDQITDTSGFASLLKSLATNVPSARFCVVGVSSDIQDLLKEHASVDRLFAGSVISMPPMSGPELKEIIRYAESHTGDYIKFDGTADDRLVQLSNGHPYLVHLIGKYALRTAFRVDQRQIAACDIDEALKLIATTGADQVLEGRYKKAVGSSSQRESVLKAMAELQAEDGEILTTNAYKRALDYGVENASQYVGHLVTDEYGAELEKLRERFYRFKDSLFASYVVARPRLVPRGP